MDTCTQQCDNNIPGWCMDWCMATLFLYHQGYTYKLSAHQDRETVQNKYVASYLKVACKWVNYYATEPRFL